MPTITAEYLADVMMRGYVRGRNCASWVEIPELGSHCRFADEQTLREVDDSNIEEYLIGWAHSSESTDRDYTPFEFTAHEFNNLEAEGASEAAWDTFGEGIDKGIREEIAVRLEVMRTRLLAEATVAKAKGN